MNVDAHAVHLLGESEGVAHVRFRVKSSSEIEFVGRIPDGDGDPASHRTTATPADSDLQITDLQSEYVLCSCDLYDTSTNETTDESSGKESTDNGSRKSITQASAPVDLDSDSSITRDKAAISRSMAYYLMERGEYEEARLQLQEVAEYQKEVSPGILLLITECSIMDGAGGPAYENFVTVITNTNITMVDLMNLHERIFPNAFDVGGLLRMGGAILMEYAILKRAVLESPDDTAYCVDALRYYLLSLEERVHQLLFKADTHKSNLCSFLLYIASQTHNGLKAHNDECAVDDALRDCIVARVYYMTGDFARSWKVTENAITKILKYDANASKYNAYGRLLCWKASLCLLKGNVDGAIPIFHSSIAALEVATDYCEHDEHSKQLMKAVKCLEAAKACLTSRG